MERCGGALKVARKSLAAAREDARLVSHLESFPFLPFTEDMVKASARMLVAYRDLWPNRPRESLLRSEEKALRDHVTRQMGDHMGSHELFVSMTFHELARFCFTGEGMRKTPQGSPQPLDGRVKHVDLALEHLQGILCGLLMPPFYLIVEQREASSDPSHNTGHSFRRWRVDAETVVEIAADGALPQQARKGFCFDYGRADFSVNVGGDVIRVGWQVGPRFGRGYDFPVEEDETGHLRFGLPRDLWDS
jgi:hypothetical protein